eukprot:CAMPEP_0114370076 /NCGR_PEP_ID=MMETSP0101-20121206/32209_1 /TAXON_ID=38822 ORGANISM="Pteridomonas danica, Strain PT" /NCGR_SAMPLE_ID=MMETSP0101 /ASSEMBLY_ACC=CAM_ASM_000211 /LENGTH=287 /DNA_ID=CAMNT_0001521365 /DNA_START=997 /DNA_END=1861 /DNA_ORIENTATION=-
MLPILFNDSGTTKKDAPFHRNDIRLRQAPSCEHQPSLQEVKDIHKKISTVMFYDSFEKVKEILPPSSSSSSSSSSIVKKNNINTHEAKPKESTKSTKDEDLKEGEDVKELPNELFVLLDSDNFAAFHALLATLKNNNQKQHQNDNENDNENNDEKGKEKEEIDEYDNEELLNLLSMKTKTEGLTLLHMASRLNKVKFVMLLLEAGANPTILDSHLRPPYYLTSSKDVRDGFRKYRGKYPNKFSSWQSSQVPEPITNEIQKEKEKLRKKEAMALALKEKKKNKLKKNY